MVGTRGSQPLKPFQKKNVGTINSYKRILTAGKNEWLPWLPIYMLLSNIYPAKIGT